MNDNELDRTYNLNAEVFYFNENGIIKPSAYQAFFAQLAEMHLAIYDSGADETLKHGLAWALISMSIKIDRHVKNGEKLNAKTWYSGRKGPFYRRELAFYDEKQQPVFKGSTFSVLLDMESRKIFRKKDLPFELTEAKDIYCLDANHKFKEKPNYTAIEERKVHPSDLDLLGHVNNRRYGDFAYDTLSEEERLNLNNLKRIDFYFLSEMRKGDFYTMMKAKENDKIFIKGENNTKGDTAFHISMEF